MEARELRIGNLFIEESSNKIIEVIGLEKNRIVFSGMFLDKWQAKPIPLTEEWLLKFGFKKDIIVDLYRLHNQFGSIIYYPSTSVEKAKIIFMLTGACFTNNTIINVHQLQNLYFALTNKELTLKP